jgi:hypothetical protein
MDIGRYKIGVAKHVDRQNEKNNMVARKARKKPKATLFKTYR